MAFNYILTRPVHIIQKIQRFVPKLLVRNSIKLPAMKNSSLVSYLTLLFFNSLLLLCMFLLPVSGRADSGLRSTAADDARTQADLARTQAGNDLTSLAARLEAHLATLTADSMEGRGLGTDGKILAKRYIAEQFRLAGIEPLGEDFLQHLDLRVGVARVPATNVVGYLEGSDPVLKDEYIVLGAHYDHLGYDYRDGERVLFPGADDNASGTAAVIELARHFAQNRDAIGRSIVFIAFDGEESGLLGARKFVEDNGTIGTEQIKLMFSLDMVGMYEANRGVSLLGMGTLHGGSDLAQRLASAQGVSIRRMTKDLPIRTDTGPFGELGIPSVHVFTGTNSPYHRPEDTYDLLDYEGMARITTYLKALVSEMSLQPELQPSRRFVAMQNPRRVYFDAGFIAHLGGAKHVFPDEYYKARPVFAFATGLYLEMHVGRRLSVQPEVLYDFNGSKSPAGTYRRHSVTIPVNLNYKLVSGPGGFFRLFPFAGGYYRHSFSGKDGELDFDFDGLHPAGEWGLNFGAGLEVMRVRAAYTWRVGLSDISAVPERPAMTRGHYLTMGFRF